jgi:photosystem II stability/assembly factor-like uncharacterized protein
MVTTSVDYTMKVAAFTLSFTLVFAVGCATTAPSLTHWEYSGGPYAQNVSALLVDDKNPDDLVAGLTSGEVYATTNAGRSWTKISVIRPQRTIYGLIQDPESRERIFATTEAGAFVSADRGKNWRLMRIEPGAGEPLPARALAIDPWRPTIIYVGVTGRGLYKSTDGGDSWFTINRGIDTKLESGQVWDIKVDVSRPDFIYATVTGLGLLRSTNAGDGWMRVTDEYSTVPTNITRCILKEKSTETIVYGTSSGNMFKSTDGGRSWSPTRNGLESDRVLTLSSQPGSPDLLLAGTENGVLVSSDFGTSWLPLSGNLPRLSASCVTAGGGSDQTLYVFGCGIGLQSTTDRGATWRRADTKLGGSTISVVGTDGRGERVYAAVRNALLYYSEQAGAWVPASTGIVGGDITSLTFDSDSPQILFVTTTVGAYKSVDGGTTWQSTTRGLRMVPQFLDAHPWIKTRMFASGDQGLFVSTNKGETWAHTRPLGSRFQVRSLTYTPTNAGIIHGASPDHGVISTTNGGISWEVSRYGLVSNDVVAITMDGRDPLLCYAWTSKGEGYRTTNRGVEWNRYAPPWKPGDTALIAVDRYVPSSVVALVNGRDLYYSSSGGTTWVPILDRDIQAEVVSVFWNARTSILYAGTREKGVYRIDIGEIVKTKLGD